MPATTAAPKPVAAAAPQTPPIFPKPPSTLPPSPPSCPLTCFGSKATSTKAVPIESATSPLRRSVLLEEGGRCEHRRGRRRREPVVALRHRHARRRRRPLPLARVHAHVEEPQHVEHLERARGERVARRPRARGCLLDGVEELAVEFEQRVWRDAGRDAHAGDASSELGAGPGTGSSSSASEG